MIMQKSAAGLAVAALAMGSALVAAVPSVAAPGTVDKLAVLSDGLLVEYDRTDGCIQTQIHVSSSIVDYSGDTRPDQQDQQVAFFDFSRTDLCTGEFLAGAAGGTEVFNQSIKSGLSGGSLKMSLDVFNFIDGSLSPVTVDLTLKATSKVVQSTTRSTTTTSGSREAQTLGSGDVDAAATGTITWGAERLVGPGDSSSFARLFSGLNKAMLQTKNG